MTKQTIISRIKWIRYIYKLKLKSLKSRICEKQTLGGCENYCKNQFEKQAGWMHNFCDICLIYKLVKKFDRFEETIDLCETFPTRIAFSCALTVVKFVVSIETGKFQPKWSSWFFWLTSKKSDPDQVRKKCMLVFFVQLYNCETFFPPRTVVIGGEG